MSISTEKFTLFESPKTTPHDKQLINTGNRWSFSNIQHIDYTNDLFKNDKLYIEYKVKGSKLYLLHLEYEDLKWELVCTPFHVQAISLLEQYCTRQMPGLVHIEVGGWTTCMTLYLDTEALSNKRLFAFHDIYLKHYVKQLIAQKTNKYDPNINKSKFELAKNEPMTGFDDYFKSELKLKDYQRNNVAWMGQLEKLASLGLNSVQYSYMENTYIKKIKLGKDKYMYDMNNDLVYSEEHMGELCITDSLQLWGGVLHDEVGLGKTVSVLTHILNTLPNDRILSFFPKKVTKQQRTKLLNAALKELEPIYDEEGTLCSTATLVLCPARLCAQWEDELNKFLKPNSDVRMYTISTVVNYNKMMKNIGQLCNADVIFVSTNIFNNSNYIQACTKDENYSLTAINWHRVVFDEGHEVLVDRSITSLKSNPSKRRLYNDIQSLKGTYKWVCSGTPLPHGNASFGATLKFLSKGEFSDGTVNRLTQKTMNNIVKQFFRHNTKKSTKDQIFIPQIVEKTIFLKQTPLEKTMYENAFGNELRMIQLCTNILVSQEDVSIIGEDVLSVSEVQRKMIGHFNGKITKVHKEIADRELKIKEAEIEYDEAHLEHTKYSDEWKELRQNCKNRIRYQEDRIELAKESIVHLEARRNLFESLNERIEQAQNEPCSICYEEIEKITLTKCSHIFCEECIREYCKGKSHIECPMCRTELNVHKDIVFDIDKENKELAKISGAYQDHLDTWGTKMAYLIKMLQLIIAQNESNRIIVFSQWTRLLELVGSALSKCGINNVYLKGNVHVMSSNIRKFRRDKSVRVIMLSSESCCSGSNLTEASHVILLDTVNGNKGEAKAIEEQAIGRAARLGQTRNVQVFRLIMRDTIEEEYYNKNIGKDVKESRLGTEKQAEVMFKIPDDPVEMGVEEGPASVLSNTSVVTV